MIKKILFILFLFPFICFGATVQNVAEQGTNNLSSVVTHYRTFLGVGKSISSHGLLLITYHPDHCA